MLSAQFYRSPQYRVVCDGAVHVTLLQPRTDFEDLIGLYLATLVPAGVNRWSAPTLIDDAAVMRVTAENYDATVLSMSDFSLNTEAHAVIDGCTNKEIVVVPTTAQSGTTSAFELQFTYAPDTHVVVRSVNGVHYSHRHSAAHVINRWQYLLVPDVTKNSADHADFDVAVSIDLLNLDKASDDYGFYLLKAPSKSIIPCKTPFDTCHRVTASRRRAELESVKDRSTPLYQGSSSAHRYVPHRRCESVFDILTPVRVTVDARATWLIVPYASVTCEIDVSATALRADQTFIFRPQHEYCHLQLRDTWCHLAAGADVSEPHFNLYAHYALTLGDEIPRQQADGSRAALDANHVVKVVLTSAVPDLDIGLALIPYQSRATLSDVRSTVLVTKYGKGTAVLALARERTPEIDLCLGDCDKITNIPLTRHTGGGDFTLTAVSTSSTCQVNVSKANERRFTSLKGKWSKDTAGGGLDHVTWRNNPHHLLTFTDSQQKSADTTLLLVRDCHV